MRQYLAAALLASSLAACTATAAGTVTPGTSAAPSNAPSAVASNDPAAPASAAPSVAASAAVGASAAPAPSATPYFDPTRGQPATLDMVALEVEGQPIPLPTAGTYKNEGESVMWEVGRTEGVMPAGTWIVTWAVNFKKGHKAGPASTTADVATPMLTFYKGTGGIPEIYMFLNLGMGPNGHGVTIAGGKATMQVDAEAKSLGGDKTIKIKGTLAGMLK